MIIFFSTRGSVVESEIQMEYVQSLYFLTSFFCCPFLLPFHHDLKKDFGFMLLIITLYGRGSQTFLYGDPLKIFLKLCDPIYFLEEEYKRALLSPHLSPPPPFQECI
jgi:hypothetical protein